MILETVGDGAGMSTVIDLDGVRNTVIVENLAHFRGSDPQIVLITHVDSDFLIAPQVADILIDEC